MGWMLVREIVIVHRKGAEAAETNDFFFAVERTAKKNRSAVSPHQKSQLFVDCLRRKRIYRPKGCAFLLSALSAENKIEFSLCFLCGSAVNKQRMEFQKSSGPHSINES